ncbi:MAG: DNA polymerase III subunit gamma/tau, partial [Pseudomonadales bacterium]|nr:DNA polymerase III subunit gamma/tau [Pseudomonadales bacterium]
MSYQVLARKYRPAVFKELEGQEHVLQALINALDNERLHHAYLFTGTRGVGKTTIARILARCLNCETGITSEPCGVCSTCVEISEGRSIDLIEVDAASRTGVDDMRELLDNVQYMPSVSRFKIYLIDEVHMLSRSSFNAMLKTLEEPPEHVKFLFATTDPKKLPITVLSRCLQFNLKNLSPEQIVKYLAAVLDLEAIAYDESALWQLGLAADGSMRDALSLTDQAISFGSSEVREEPVGEMLGSIDAKVVFQLLADITSANGQRLLETVAQLSDFAPNYAALLDDILAALHRIAIAQAVDGAVDNSQGDEQQVLQAAERIPSEQVQLFYQIGLIGQRDLPLAPTPRTGFEMVLLRMMSFTPVSLVPGQAESGVQPKPSPGGVASNKIQSARTSPHATKAAPIKDLMSAIRGDIQGLEESDQPAVAETAGKALAPALEAANWTEIL